MSPFRLLMISAMYENGGNTTHRFLDGHPQIFTYPFESQPGTQLVQDSLTSMFPVKYRWPEFALSATPYQDYKSIIDEECKVRARTPNVSKFRHMPFDFSDDERCEIYTRYVEESGRSRGNNVAAFFRATFDAWKDYARTGDEIIHLGYSPIIIVDGEKIMQDMPDAHILHIVRNPWSAYADTKKRAVPLSLANYILCWVINQHHALLCRQKYPDNVHIIRIEDVMADPAATLGDFCENIGLETPDSLSTPSWNGTELEEVYPWGTIRKATPTANIATANELSDEEKEEVRMRAGHFLEVFDYQDVIHNE